MKRRAFTLIELLTVIAIIALLAAIIYPVFSAAQRNARKSACMANMNQIYQALKLYHSDYDAYPPILLGFVEIYSNVTQPCNQLKQSPLFPSRITSVDLFHCPLNNVPNLLATTTAVFPHVDGINSNTGKPDAPGFPPGTVMKYNGVDALYYVYDSYDIGRSNPKIPPSLSNPYELHYMLFWTKDGLGGGSPDDDPRQLGYRHPDETAVVTWCNYHRNWPMGAAEPNHDKEDVVLFLNGQVKAMDSDNVSHRGWGQIPTGQ